MRNDSAVIDGDSKTQSLLMLIEYGYLYIYVFEISALFFLSEGQLSKITDNYNVRCSRMKITTFCIYVCQSTIQ